MLKYFRDLDHINANVINANGDIHLKIPDMIILGNMAMLPSEDQIPSSLKTSKFATRTSLFAWDALTFLE